MHLHRISIYVTSLSSYFNIRRHYWINVVIVTVAFFIFWAYFNIFLLYAPIIYILHINNIINAIYITYITTTNCQLVIYYSKSFLKACYKVDCSIKEEYLMEVGSLLKNKAERRNIVGSAFYKMWCKKYSHKFLLFVEKEGRKKNMSLN